MEWMFEISGEFVIGMVDNFVRELEFIAFVSILESQEYLQYLQRVQSSLIPMKGVH